MSIKQIFPLMSWCRHRLFVSVWPFSQPLIFPRPHTELVSKIIKWRKGFWVEQYFHSILFFLFLSARKGKTIFCKLIVIYLNVHFIHDKRKRHLRFDIIVSCMHSPFPLFHSHFQLLKSLVLTFEVYFS